MEFITVEQFREQPEEVQKVFLDWWECEPYDLYAFPWNRRTNTWCIGSCCNQIQADSINKSKDIDINIPIFTEGQIRRFVEDKLCCLLDIKVEDLDCDYNFYTVIGWEVREVEYWKEFGKILFEDCIKAKDLLQAYWKVACMIAKEVVQHV